MNIKEKAGLGLIISAFLVIPILCTIRHTHHTMPIFLAPLAVSLLISGALLYFMAGQITKDGEKDV